MRGDTTRLENVKVLMLKGEKGDKGDPGSGSYDDTEIRAEIASAEADITALQNTVTPMETNYNNLVAETASNTNAIGSIQSQQTTNTGNISDLMARFTTYSGDLDDLVSSGIYWCPSAVGHNPYTTMGVCIVGATRNETYATQIFFPSGVDGYFLRRKYSDGWHDWIEDNFKTLTTTVNGLVASVATNTANIATVTALASSTAEDVVDLTSRFVNYTGAMNDLTRSGLYFCPSATVDLPLQRTSVVMVIAGASAGYVKQVVYPLSYNGVYSRWYSSSAWGEWVETDYDDIHDWSSDISSLQSRTTANETAIAANTTTIADHTARFSIFNGNLNDLVKSGLYYCTTSATNLPAGTFGYCIIAGNNGTQAQQLYFAPGLDGLYIRRRSSDTWGSWLSTDFDAIKTQLVSQASAITTLNGRFTSFSGDLDQLIEAGMHYCTTSSSHLPDSKTSGYVIVISNGGSYSQQIFFAPGVDGLYMRRRSGDSYGSWVLTDFGEIKTQLAAQTATLATHSADITALNSWTADNGRLVTDLNGVIANGFYRYASSANGRPSSASGALIVASYSSSVIYQVALVNTTSQSPRIYTRHSISDVWSDWVDLRNVAGEAAIENTSVSVSYGNYNGTINLYKRNGIVELKFGFFAGATDWANVTGDDSIGTIPEGWRPNVAVYIPILFRAGAATAYTTNGFVSATLTVTASGDIVIRGKQTELSACRTAYCGGTYLLG